jgi:hypothetical protein
VAKLFAVTECLVSAGIAPSIHQGRGIIVSALSKSTVRATIEFSDDEEDFSFEIVKEELWRAVRLSGFSRSMVAAARFRPRRRVSTAKLSASRWLACI